MNKGAGEDVSPIKLFLKDSELLTMSIFLSRFFNFFLQMVYVRFVQIMRGKLENQLWHHGFYIQPLRLYFS